MKIKKIAKTAFCGMSLWAFLALTDYHTSPFAWAQQSLLLGEKHKNAGVSCEGCHRDEAAKEQVSTAVCIGCHGDYPKIAELRAKSSPNPHESHLGNLKCESCHHVHKLSEDYCGKCHLIEFKVP
jgi:hypothetical protein